MNCVGRSGAGDDGERSLGHSSPQKTCVGVHSVDSAPIAGSRHADEKQQCSLLLNSWWCYSSGFGTALRRFFQITKTSLLSAAKWGDADDGDRRLFSFLRSGASSRGFYSWYDALPTTRLCSIILPQESDGPLILHLAVLLVGLEVMQATTFYVRYRRAMQASRMEMANDMQGCDRSLEDAGRQSDASSTSFHPATAGALPSPEVESLRTARSCQLQGSSRAMRRLCSYWALLEKAVQAAPRKRAGAPTRVTDIGCIFRSSFPGCHTNGGGDEDRRFGQLTSDGVPHGAEAVLVLPDDITFPIMTGPSKENSGQTPFAASVAASTVQGVPPGAGHSSNTVSSTVTEGPIEVAEPWKALHLLWTDVVRYSVTYSELRQLLLGCTVAEIGKLFEKGVAADSGWLSSCTTRSTQVLQSVLQSVSRCNASGDALSHTSYTNVNSPLHPSAAASFSTYCAASPLSRGSSPRHSADPRVAVACLALTWYLSLVREVYEAVIVYEDVERCADALEELEEYSRVVYEHGIATGSTFFEEVLQSFPQPRADDAGSNTHRVADTQAERVSAEPPHSEHTMVLPEVLSMTHEGPDDAFVGLTESSAWHPHLSSTCEPHGNDPLCSDAVYGRPTSSLVPRGQNEVESATAASIRLRGASPRACWAELSAALAALLRRRRLMVVSHVRSLFSYMYTESVGKAVSFMVLTLLTCLSSRVAAAGLAAREAISSNLDTYYRGQQELPTSSSDDGSERESCGGGGITAQQRILSLCIFECTRLAVNTVLIHTTHECITVAASQRRNAVKAKLYEALTRLPLAFFDLHSFDEVEQIVYYVNDIEGVEVHVHQYACVLVKSLFAMQHAMCQLPYQARFLVGATVAVSLTVKYIGQRIKQWVQTAQRIGGVFPPWLRGFNGDGTASVMAELDAQVEENTESNARQGGVMLRGLDIVAVLPQLRPYAADLTLMRWWMQHIQACGVAVGSTEVATFAQSALIMLYQAYGKVLPALGGALITFADWGLPTLVASYGASIAFCNVDALTLSNRLMEAMRCVGDTVDALVDGRRVVEVVLLNAYKASVLEKMLDTRRWEPTSADYARNFVYKHASDEAADADDGDEDQYPGARSHSESRAAAMAAAAATTGPTRYDNRRRILRSFCRADSKPTVAAAWPARATAWCVRVWRRDSICCVSPQIQVVCGSLRLVRRVLSQVGRMVTGRNTRKLGASRSLHLRGRRRRSQHAAFLRGSQRRRRGVQHESLPQLESPRQKEGGSTSILTEVWESRQVSEDDLIQGDGRFPSMSSFSDSSIVDGEAAAEVLASATVHAVTVHSVQFYYPSAPTVPVFPRPISCSFTLQESTDASPRTCNAQDSLYHRGRLVCLVGPSGHGKSTLLSLFLGMYTNYGAAGDILDPENYATSGFDDSVDQPEGGAASPGEQELPFTRFVPTPTPDIVLTLSLPHTPAPSSDELEVAVSQDATSIPEPSTPSEVVHVRLSVSSIPRDILRGHLFSFVPQTPVIFSGATIAHNISLENYISLEREELLAEIAQCASWAHCEYIQRFPQGLMTYIAESGTGAWASPLAAASSGGGGGGGGGCAVRLSGGQAQRLMVARALFHGRRGGAVLVMDEPTASLDKEVKFQILEELRELLYRGIVRGIICATHDDDLIAVADEVVRLP